MPIENEVEQQLELVSLGNRLFYQSRLPVRENTCLVYSRNGTRITCTDFDNVEFLKELPCDGKLQQLELEGRDQM